jgi:hypothetical protein
VNPESARQTRSEWLFERFCALNGIPFIRVPEATEQRPDYRMILPSTHVVVEVKELEPTSEERAVIESDPETFDPTLSYHWGMPGEKIRKKIASAVPQLKALSRGTLPALLVLHDPIRFWPELLDSDSMRAAMYGIETALISPVPAPEGGATILKRWHGGRKKLTELHNTSLSAIAVMFSECDTPQMEVFHNWYAAVPLEPSTFRVNGVVHFRLAGPPSSDFPPWERTS